MFNKRLVPLIALLFCLLACSSTGNDAPLDTSEPAAEVVADMGLDLLLPEEIEAELPRTWPEPPETLGGDRPATWFAPADYTPDKAWPLVLLLHGRSASGFLQDSLFQLSAQVDEKGFLLVTPDGTKDDDGLPCWNATGTCCKADGSGVDDVAYLLSLVDEMGTYFRVDEHRIYIIGHSNGGFMSYRMACEAGDRIAAIVSLAGMDWVGASGCVPEHPVGVLHVHGTADETIDYLGADGPAGPDPHYGDFPSAQESAAGWAARDGCGPAEAGTALDLVSDLAGAETSTMEWSGCQDDLRVALWTIEGGSHIPNVMDGKFARQALDFLLSQSR